MSLERPERFAMAWTHYENINEIAALSARFRRLANERREATRQFWPAGQLQSGAQSRILEQVRAAGRRSKSLFGDVWAAEDGHCATARLYALDMTIFECLSRRPTILREVYPQHSPCCGGSLDTKPEPVRSGFRQERRRPAALREKATPSAGAPFRPQGIHHRLCVFLRHVYLWHVVPSAMR